MVNRLMPVICRFLGIAIAMDEFLRQFPAVCKEQALTALDAARDSLLAGARSS